MNVVYDPLEQKTKRCTSDYKSRNKARPNHNGMDLISYSSKNNYIVAVEDGIVSYSGYDSKSGYYVFVLHPNKYKTFYCHMKQGSVLVKKGDKVVKGQRIGLMGETGSAQGVHLHFGVKNTAPVWVDPLPVLEGKLKLNGEWCEGEYTVLKAKYVRTSPMVTSNNKLKYARLNNAMKNICIADAAGNAKFKVGAKVKISKFQMDTKGNVWGMRKGVNTDTWLCVQDSTGKQVK